MPYQRAVSPFSLETCEPSSQDTISDELPASDDELSETERAAKRRRIEKLAESYLQGQPLFILSASLKGPFDQGWRNPWKKDRKSVINRHERKCGNRAVQHEGRLVQETDLRHPKYRENVAVTAPSLPTAAGSPAFSPDPPLSNVSSIHTTRQAQKRPLRAASGDEQNHATPRSIKKPREATSKNTTDHSFATGGSADWLKKDRKRMNFTQFEPPSSPTPKVLSRQAETKARMGDSRTLEVRETAMSVRRRDSSVRPADERAMPSERTENSPSQVRAAMPIEQNHHPRFAARSLIQEASTRLHESPDLDADAASSFRIISSTSQLPRFEYRRWHQESDSLEAALQSPVKAAVSGATNNPTPKITSISSTTEGTWPELASKDMKGDVKVAPETVSTNGLSGSCPKKDAATRVDQIGPSDVPLTTDQKLAAIVEHDIDNFNEPRDIDALDASNMDRLKTTKDSALAKEAGTSTCVDTENQPQTEPSTCENLPSAQHVPLPPGVSYRVASLHSTAMPKPNSDSNAQDDADTQFSTQAALIHAQRTFQEDLESPEPDFIHPPEPEDTVLGPEEESLLAHETPYYIPQAPERGSQASLQRLSKDRMQAMSTQCMIEAVTPYTFSTEKKPKAFRELSPAQPTADRSEKPRIADILVTSPRIPLPPQGHDDYTGHSSPDAPFPLPDTTFTHRSTTQGTFLPLALSGSTPTTAQDGQGGQQGAESFDLSQAIADAGSWLQQSFDLVKDLGRSGRPAEPN